MASHADYNEINETSLWFEGNLVVMIGRARYCIIPVSTGRHFGICVDFDNSIMVNLWDDVNHLTFGEINE